MNGKLSRISFVLLSWLAVFSVTMPVAAETDLLPSDYQAPGDGRTPTFFQYLDTQGYSATPVRNLVGDSDKGDVTYRASLELPSALLKPNLALSYSSAKGADREMAYGWTLDGILEIRRPTTRAFNSCKNKTDCENAEWLIAGSGFSGTLKPSGNGDYLVTTQIADLRGLTTATGHPENKGAAFSAPTTSISIAKTFGKSYHDALGATRETIRDAAIATGSQLVYRDKPRKELRQDEEGYQTELTYDAQGRVIKVRQGKGGTLSKTA